MSVTAIIADSVIAIALLISLILGIKRGFIATVAKPVKILAALACAIFLSSLVGSQLIQPYVDQPIRNSLTTYLNEKCPELSEENAVEKLPTMLKFAASIGNVDLNALAAEGDGDLAVAITDRLTQPLARILATAIAFILLYIVARLVLWILIAILNGLFNTPILAWLNKGLGLIFGGLIGMLTIWGIVVAAEFVFGFAFADATWVADIRSGWIYGFFRGFSPLDLIFGF